MLEYLPFIWKNNLNCGYCIKSALTQERGGNIKKIKFYTRIDYSTCQCE